MKQKRRPFSQRLFKDSQNNNNNNNNNNEWQTKNHQRAFPKVIIIIV